MSFKTKATIPGRDPDSGNGVALGQRSAPMRDSTANLLASGLQGALGNTVGPDGLLYATEGVTGRVLRVDPNTGETTVFASGVPKRVLAVARATDVAFIGNTAYVLVKLVRRGRC